MKYGIRWGKNRMASFGFISFILSCMLFQCEGGIISPAKGTEFVFLFGSTVNITWIFDDAISSLFFRAWYFTRRGGSTPARLPTIISNNDPDIPKSSLSGVEIVKPGTLLLKNVNQSHNGIYKFELSASGPAVVSDVTVFIAIKPTVSLNCSSPITVNEGNEFTCVCRGEGQNPPANVTWLKDGIQIAETGREEQTLTLRSVDETDNGTYKCVAQSYTDAMFSDQKIIEIIIRLNFKPNNTAITITPEQAEVGNSVTIGCRSAGVPEPSYTITLNGITIVSTSKTYTIPEVKRSDEGTYKCIARNKLGNDSASANLIVVVKPTVTFSCSSPITVDEGDNFTCVCRGEGGNPPANVTWYKDSVQIGKTGKENQTLTIVDVDKTDSGTYKCVAQSHINAKFADEKSVEAEVNFKPRKTAMMFSPRKAVVGRSVLVSCESDGFPEPSYTIFHNDSVISTQKSHSIPKVKWSDSGSYQCIAENKLGRNSKCYCLTVVEDAAAFKKVNYESCGTFEAWHIVVSLLSGIIIGLFLAYIVLSAYRRWFRNGKPGQNPEPQTTEADTTYQQLDLSKMNTEDKYQSLRGNAASNDDDITYTELNTAKDVENNYQSLI